MRSWTRNLCPQPTAVKDIQEPSVKLAERRHAPALERATMVLTTPSGHPALGSSETSSFLRHPPRPPRDGPWAGPELVSEINLHNRRCQGVVSRAFHGPSARRCPRLHRRPATLPLGQRPDRCRLRPGGHRDGQRRLYRPPDPGAVPGPGTAMPSRVVRLATTARLVGEAAAAFLAPARSGC
jgi:hypothetical protein